MLYLLAGVCSFLGAFSCLEDSFKLGVIMKWFSAYWSTGQPHSFLKYDYAMIKLKTAFTLTKKINPICLPINKEIPDLSSNQKFITAGWGDGETTPGVENKMERISDELRAIDLNRVTVLGGDLF